MSLRPLLRLPAALFLVTLTACSGSSKEDTTAADTGASDATDTGTGEDTGNTDSGDTANTDSGDTATTDTEDTAAQGACQNEADLAIHGDPAYDPFEKAVACGLDSISLLLSANWDAFAAAFSTCMSDPTYRGDSRYAFTLTEACTDCYGAHVLCVAEFCINACGPDPSAQGCVDCQESAGCYDNFATCSGFPRQ